MRFSLLLLLAITATANAAEITLREEASTSVGTLVCLGDVATVKGTDAERLAGLPLMPNPSPGTRQFVSAAAVRAMLAAQGESPETHRFAGAYRVRVETPALASDPVANQWKPAAKRSNTTAFRVRPQATRPTTIAPRRTTVRSQAATIEAVKAAIQLAIDADAEQDAPPIAVEKVQLSATAMRELSELLDQPIIAEFLPMQPARAGSIRVRISPAARLGGEAFDVVADLVEQPMRVVVTTPIARGVLVTASSVKLEPVPVDEINRPQSLGYTKLEQVVGREAKRPLRVGQVLSDSNTDAPLMVRRGEEVEVISGGGGVSVRLFAQAKQEGRRGDLITVRLLDRDEEFTARVVGHRQLAVLSARGGLAGVPRLGGLR